MSPLHYSTPLFEDLETGAQLGKRILLKMECFQPTGSFKIRGIGLLCQRRVQAGRNHLVSSSGGNAGLAVAYAARQLGAKATVVVPETTPPATRKMLERNGAGMVVYGSVWNEADAAARRLADQGGAAYISPFDDPLIWEGNASLVDELAAAGAKPDAIVLSVGGGGLLCGVVEGLERNGWGGVRVVAAETLGADSLHQSLQAGKQVTLPAITSIAKSLGALRVADEAFARAQRAGVISVTVSDRAAVRACLRLVDSARALVEPACGASLAVAYENHAAIRDARTVVVVVCGGVSVAVDQLRAWSDKLES